MPHPLLAVIALMIIFGTQCHAQDGKESNLSTEPAILAAENAEADNVIIIEMSTDMGGSELIRGVVKSLEEDGIAKTVPMNTSFIRPLDFNARILVNPNLSSDSIFQAVKTLNVLRVQRVTFGMTNPNGTNDLILTCPPDVTWREVRYLQDALKNHNEFKVDIRVSGTDGQATSTFTPTYANEPKLPAGDTPDTSGDNPLPGADADQRSVSVRLRYRDATAIARIIRQVLNRPNEQPFGVVTDELINEIRFYGDSKLVHEAEQMLRRLDVPENQWMGPGDGYQSPPPTQPALPLNNATDATGALLKQEIADFRERVEDLDRQGRRLAAQLKQPVKDPAEAERLNVLLRDVVNKSFATRQKLRRAELELFAIRLGDLKQSVELRDRIADKIIDRRIEELLDPNLSWESPDESAPLVDVPATDSPNVDRSQRVLAFLHVDKSESEENIHWLMTRLEAIGISNFTVTRGGKPSIVDILCPHDFPSDERSRLEREIKTIVEEASIEWSLRIATAGPPLLPPGQELSRNRKSNTSAAPAFKNLGNGIGVPLNPDAANSERPLWAKFGVTPTPVSDPTAQILEAIGLHLSPIDNILGTYPSGLKATFVRTGGPVEEVGILEGDIVVALQTQRVSTVQEFDVALQDALKNLNSGTTNSLAFDVLRNGEAARIKVSSPASLFDLVREDSIGMVSEDLQPAERRLEICEASELSAEEAATLAKSEGSREILYLHDGGQIVPLRRKPETLLNESDLVSAVAKTDPDIEGAYSIDLQLKPQAAERFARETKRLSLQLPTVRLAILDSGILHSAPRLVSEILDGKMRITGRFTKQEAEQFAADLTRSIDPPVLRER